MCEELIPLSDAVEVKYPHLGSDMEVVHSLGAHERQLHVCVRVDAARDHQLLGGINDSHPRWDLKILSNFNYFPLFNVDVADHGAVLIHNFTPLYQDPAGLCHSCCAQLRERVKCMKEPGFVQTGQR